MTTKDKNFWGITLIFVGAKLCFHFFTNTNYELHRDEMLYFNMGEHLSAGYVSVPPMIGFFAWIIKSVFGYSVFGIRFFPAVLGALSIFIMAKTIRDLGGGYLALVMALSAFLFSTVFLLFDTLFTPNVIEQFLWLVIMYLVFRLVVSQNTRIWIWIGVTAGLSLLTKYSIVFLITGFLIAIILSQHRKLLLSRYFIYAICIAFIIFSPNLIWQFSHNWPVMHHMEQLNKTQMTNMRYSFYLADIFTLNSISSLIWIVGIVVLIFVKKERAYQYIGIAALIIILLFMVSGGKGYYMLGLVPFLFVFGAYSMEKFIREKFNWINHTIITLSIIASLLALPYALPVLSFENLSKYSEATGNLIIYPFSRWEDGKSYKTSQVYSDMTGWKELASIVAKAYSQLSNEEQKTCTIFAERNYGYAGAIHFYGKKYQLPDAITFLDNYVLWAPDTIPNGVFIYIYKNMGETVHLFDTVTVTGQVNDPYFRESGLKVFVCTSPKTDIRKTYSQMAMKEKSIYE